MDNFCGVFEFWNCYAELGGASAGAFCSCKTAHSSRPCGIHAIPPSTPPDRCCWCGRWCSGSCAWSRSSGWTSWSWCPPHWTKPKTPSWEKWWTSIPLQDRYLCCHLYCFRIMSNWLLLRDTSLSLIGLTVHDSVMMIPYHGMLLLHLPSSHLYRLMASNIEYCAHS